MKLREQSNSMARQPAGFNFGKLYLFLYNFTLSVGFLSVFITLITKTLTQSVTEETIASACSVVKFLTITQFIESIHPILGLVPGGPFMPFAQIIGRFFVMIFLDELEIRHNTQPFVVYLFIVWSAIEIIRYPYYALRVINKEIKLLTWLRYSLFLPLYPCGGFCETMVVLNSIDFYEKTGKWSLALPNEYNISFCLPTALRVYVGVFLYPTILMLMSYMWSQRKKQLGTREKLS